MFKKYKIKHRICTSEDYHCPFVERVVRTVKEKLFQALTTRRTRRWIDLLSDIVSSYNKTRHSTTQMRPIDAAKDENTLEVYNNTLKRYPPKKKKKKYKFKVGDLVRIYKAGDREVGNKGYLPRFTWEIFRIAKLANNRSAAEDKQIPAYIPEDLNGEKLNMPYSTRAN